MGERERGAVGEGPRVDGALGLELDVPSRRRVHVRLPHRVYRLLQAPGGP